MIVRTLTYQNWHDTFFFEKVFFFVQTPFLKDVFVVVYTSEIIYDASAPPGDRERKKFEKKKREH